MKLRERLRRDVPVTRGEVWLTAVLTLVLASLIAVVAVNPAPAPSTPPPVSCPQEDMCYADYTNGTWTIVPTNP